MARRPRASQQLRLPRTSTWGGHRPGGGRQKGPRVSHARRLRFKRRPLHVTLRVLPHVWNLRSERCFDIIGAAFEAGCDRFGMRLIDFDIIGNHLHFIVECDDQRALSRGMQGLMIRIARGLNRLMGRRGKVFADRYHAHALSSPREVRNAIAYVIDNFASHERRAGRRVPPDADCYSSRGLRRRSPRRFCVAPSLWLLRKALGLIP